MKMTKIGELPVDWECAKLGSITDLKRGRFSPRPRNDPKFYGGNIPFVQTGDVANSNGRVKTYSQTLNSKGLKVSILFPKGTILITIAANIGHTAILNFDMACPDSLIGIICKERINIEYLNNYLNIKRKNIEYLSPSAAQKNINVEFLDSFLIPVPPLSEQKKIAKILSTWDRATEILEKLIEAKKKLKKGLMQQLLTGKRRFNKNKNWNRILFSSFLLPTSYPIPKPIKPYTSLGIRSHGKGTLARDVDDPSKVAMDTLYEVKKNELIINITFAWEGAVAFLQAQDEGHLVSHRFPTYKFDKNVVLPDYFKQVIKTKRFVFCLRLISPGGAGRNRVLDKKDFLKLQWEIPLKDEQNKIASCLNTYDNEIDLLEKKMDMLKAQKKGLMQKLLTGKIRVKV